MRCPKCNSENSDNSKFCRKCGTPLTKSDSVSHQSMIDSMNKESKGDSTKIIIAVLVIIAVILAGAFAYITFFTNHDKSTEPAVINSGGSSDVTPTTHVAESASSPMKILSGSFSTGSAEEDKTYASLYVGPEHAGESVIVQIYYSRDGNSLNNGNMVPVHVDSRGYIDVASADAYHYYPDNAKINLYDSNSNLMDTHTVSLTPTSGTQSF